jgi:phosphate transport system protein
MTDGRHVRAHYTAELEQLRLQVEVMAVRVDQNLERMREVLRTGDAAVADQALCDDDEIDAMNLSLTERCYELLAREAPVATDLRLIVSVVRVLSELERIGDLALRVVKLQPQHELVAGNEGTFDILLSMADESVERYRLALRAWAGDDLDLATELATTDGAMNVVRERLEAELVRMDGPGAVEIALATDNAGRALERIADHARIIGARLRYLITGDPHHLAAEVR